MALPEPPSNVPRIVTVQNPAEGQYVVMVRMPTQLAAKWPDKPWGTSIAAVGLSKKDADLYPDYVLVEVQAMKGAADLMWVFQKLGGPIWSTKSKGVENLTPAKYRRLITTLRTEQEVAQDTEPDTPDGTITTSVVQQQKDTGKAVKINTTETIATDDNSLVGEEYGDIVTKSVTESLVEDGAAADTGIDVISSTVEPLGNGKSVKQTKRAKDPGWPNPIDQEVSVEGSEMPPARYRKDLTRTNTPRKVLPISIPTAPTLSGNEVGKSYKKETPDRAEETTTTQNFTLNTSSVDEAIEQKPFVTIRSQMTPGTTPVLPTTGNGSSKLVYEAPNGSKIYENVAEIATARSGPAGTEKDVKPFVKIDTAKRYSTSNAVATLTGSANVVFNDGAIQIYEVSEVISTGRYGPAGAEQQVKPFVKITSTKTYTKTGELGAGEVGSSNKIYDDGTTVVYEKSVDTATAKEKNASTDKEEKPFVKIETKKRYSKSNAITTKTGSANVIFDDGTTIIYEIAEPVATAKPGLGGKDKDKKPYGEFVTEKKYATDQSIPTPTGSSKIIFDDGTTKVYENSEIKFTARQASAGKEVDKKPFVKITTNKKYSVNDTISTPTGSASVIYDDTLDRVYEITEPRAQATPYTLLTGKDVKLGYRVEETEVYDTSTNLATKTGNVNVAFDDGTTRVYKKTEVRGYLNNVEFDSSVKNTKMFKETVHTSFKTSAIGSDDKDWDGQLVFTDGDLKVFRIDETSIVKKNTLTYYSVVHADMPSVLKDILIEPIEMLPNSDGKVRDKICIRAIIEEGYSGLFKAKIEEFYTKDNAEANSFEPLIFKPTAINYDGLNFGISISKTLHQQIIFTDSIGTNDPDYAPNQTLSVPFRTFAATEQYTAIPSGYHPHAIQIEPYKNGFLVKKIYIQYKK